MFSCLKMCNCGTDPQNEVEEQDLVPGLKDIYQRGLSLGGLRRIYENISIPDDEKGPLNGGLVVNLLVKPETESYKCSYVEYLYQDDTWRDSIGQCTTFLSHPWSANFRDTLAAMGDYEDKLPVNSPAQFYFVDYFAVNQHDAQDDLENLARVVQQCKSLVLMAQPYKNPVSLGRIWCIFELAHAVLGQNEIILILPPEEEKRFQKQMRESVKELWAFVDQLFSKIDSGKAKATVQSDVISIRNFIRSRLGGFIKVDTMISDALRRWYLQSVMRLVQRFPDAEKGSISHASLQYDVARFYSSQARWLEAHNLYKEAKAVYVKNKQTPKGLECEYNAIRMLARMGKLKEALELCTQNVRSCIEEFGEDNGQTLNSKKLKGDTYRELGMLEKSEKVLREVLASHKQTRPTRDYHIFNSMVALAETLRDACKWDEAKNLLHDVIKSRIETNGRQNPVTLNSVTKYARLIALAGEPEEAIPLFQAIIPEIRLKYGADDIYVRNSECWLEHATSRSSIRRESQLREQLKRALEVGEKEKDLEKLVGEKEMKKLEGEKEMEKLELLSKEWLQDARTSCQTSSKIIVELEDSEETQEEPLLPNEALDKLLDEIEKGDWRTLGARFQ